MPEPNNSYQIYVIRHSLLRYSCELLHRINIRMENHSAMEAIDLIGHLASRENRRVCATHVHVI